MPSMHTPIHPPATDHSDPGIHVPHHQPGVRHLVRLGLVLGKGRGREISARTPASAAGRARRGACLLAGACRPRPAGAALPPPLPPRFGIGIFYVLLYMLLKVAFDSAGWLVQIGNVVQLLYLFLIIVQVRRGARGGRFGAGVWGAAGPPGAAVTHLLLARRSPPLPRLDLTAPQLIINLKNKPEAVEKIHSFCAIYFCLYMLVFTGVSIRCAACLDWAAACPSRVGASGAGPAALPSLWQVPDRPLNILPTHAFPAASWSPTWTTRSWASPPTSWPWCAGLGLPWPGLAWAPAGRACVRRACPAAAPRAAGSAGSAAPLLHCRPGQPPR